MFHQPDLEALLAARAESLPTVEVRRGVEITGLERADGAVDLHDAHGEVVRAAHVVGCDGANSAVRRLAGIEMVDLGFFHDWLIVDVILDEPRVFDPLNVQVCDPRRPTTAVSGGPGRRRWEFMRLPGETLDELDAEDRAWELLEPWGVRPDGARLERHAVYTFQARHAERWRDGRVLIAGDAAHLMPPFAGQGMCAGVRDAANLAWKLDLVLAGDAPDALLDTYEAERLPSARSAIELSMALGEVICVADAGEAAARDESMAAAVTDRVTPAPEPLRLDDGVLDAGGAHAGRLAGQPRAGDRWFDDVHGAGWRLVTTDADHAALVPAAVAWFSSIGGAVVVVDDADLDGGWWPSFEARWLLQRPDFHVFGTTADAAGATELLTRLRARLRSDAPAATTAGTAGTTAIEGMSS